MKTDDRRENSMTLNEVSVPALEVEERSDPRPPGPAAPDRPRTRRLWPSRSGASSPQSISCGFWRRRIAARSPARWAACFAREGLYSSHLTAWAQGAAQGLAAGVGREEARRETGRTQPAGCEGARARGASGSPGARVAHRAHDPGRAGKSCRLLGLNLEHGTRS